MSIQSRSKFAPFSPSDIETLYGRAESSCIRNLSSLPLWMIPLVVVAIEAIFVFYISFMQSHRLLEMGGFASIQLIKFALMIVVPTSLISLFTAGNPHIVVRYSLIFLLWIVNACGFFWIAGSFTTTALCACAIPIIYLGDFFFLQPKKVGGWTTSKPWMGRLIFTILTSAFAISISCVLYAKNRFGMIAGFWGFKPQVLIISLLILRGQRTRAAGADHVANPLNGLIGVFWPQDLSQVLNSEKLNLWWAGIFTLSQGILLWGAYLLLQNANYFPQELNTYTASRLLSNLLGDVAFLNVLTGCARIMGYKVQSATNFLCLARTPADSWRRGNVYNYLFSLKYIFVPVFRSSKSRLLATLIAFSMYYVNGETRRHVYSILSLRTKPADFQLDAALFIIHFLLIYITSKYWIIPKIKMNSAGYAWLSVLLTHALRLLAVSLARNIIN